MTAPAEPAAVVNRALVERLAKSWPGRAAVRSGQFESAVAAAAVAFDPAVPDYPHELVPFWDHPRFHAASPEQRQAVLTSAWLVYNDRVITAEEQVANPALTMVMHGAFPGADDAGMRRAVQQSLVDETFHTYIHMVAVDRTRSARGLAGPAAGWPPSVTFRRYRQACAGAGSEWERKLLALVWTVVSEVSINAYLVLLSRNDAIQPLHRLVTHLHDRDEAAHGRLMVEVAKSLYCHMTAEQRRAFTAALAPALHAFVAHDFSAWAAVLGYVGVAGADEIVADCRADPGTGTLVRDFSGLRRLAAELEILDQLDVELPTNPVLVDRDQAAATA